MLVGNLTFARLCFTLSLEPVLTHDLPGYDLDLDDLWKHSLTTAYGAAYLVKSIGLGDLRDRAFTAGLLHDVGKLVLDHGLDEDCSEDDGQVTMDRERHCTGYDHAEAGAALLESWDVPEQVIAAVRWHHDPLKAGDHKRLALAVSVANEVGNFATRLRTGSSAVDTWVQKSFDSSAFPLEKISKLATTILDKNQNILSLALGPGM